MIWHQCLLRVEYDRENLLDLPSNVRLPNQYLNNVDDVDGVSTFKYHSSIKCPATACSQKDDGPVRWLVLVLVWASSCWFFVRGKHCWLAGLG